MPTRRTSLVVDPPDGRVPALSPEAQQRLAAAAEARKLRGPADHPEDRNLWKRCLTRGMPTVMLPQVYNGHYQIIQPIDHVVILAGWFRRAHHSRAPAVRSAAGHPSFWRFDRAVERDTLVVLNTNFTNKTNYRGAGENLRLVERFTRTAPDILTYRVTIDDPTTFTRPWTVELPAVRSDGRIYEYACHEANYGLEGILRGHRAEEQRAATTAPKKSQQ